MTNPLWGAFWGLVIGLGLVYGMVSCANANYNAQFRNCLAQGFTQGQCVVIIGPNRWE